MSRTARFLSLALSFAVLAFAPGCKQEEQSSDDDGAAGQAVDSVEVAQNEAAFVVAATDRAGTDATAAEVAEIAASSATTAYQPSSCVTAERTGTTVVYTLNDCTGPYGLIHVTGEVTVIFSDGDDGLHADVAATGLDVNGATIDVDASAVYTVSGANKSLLVSTNSSGVGARGSKLSREGDYTVTWNNEDSCFGLDGDWSTQVGIFSWDTRVSGYDRCADQCPVAGGEVIYTGEKGRTLTIRFDGSDAATWEGSSGRTGTIDLPCGG